MTLRRLAYAVGIIVAAFLTALATFDLNHFAPAIEDWARGEAQRHRVRLAISELSLGWQRARAREIELFIAASRVGFIPLRIETPEVTWRWWSLLGLSPSMRAQAESYGGTLKAEATYSITARTTNGTGSIQALNLAKHPQLAAFGFERGLLNAELTNVRHAPPQAYPLGDFVLRIEGLEKPDSSRLSLVSVGIPLSVDLPALRISSANVRGSSHGERIELSEVVIATSLGDLSGGVTFKLNSRGVIGEVAGSFDVRLSANGNALLGPYLPIISQGALTSSTNNFRLRISGRPPLPQLAWRAL